MCILRAQYTQHTFFASEITDRTNQHPVVMSAVVGLAVSLLFSYPKTFESGEHFLA